jgi:iron complex outermembrane recepter protein
MLRRKGFHLYKYTLVLATALVPAQAWAQRTTENVTTASSDAFGTAIGQERTGLYTPEEVRGFSPLDAGNARIEGLYFDQIDRPPMRVVEGSTVRVGISAQHLLFPAPTGLVDYSLTKPGADLSASLDMDTGPYFGPAMSLTAKVPLAGETLGLSFGVGGRESKQPDGAVWRFRNYGATVVWRPYEHAEVLAFHGEIILRDGEIRPTLFPAGAVLPPQVKRGLDLSQPWSDRATNNRTSGLIVRLPVAGFDVAGGLFFGHRDTRSIFADIMTGVTPDGAVASRRIIADGDFFDQSLSGEFRIGRGWQTGSVTHRLTASLRGRHKQRTFGGSRTIALGPSTLLAPDIRPLPSYTLGPKNSDDVRQLTYGLSYGLEWNRRFSLDIGLSKSDYRKQIDFADPLLADPLTREQPWLWNANASFALSSAITAYGGVSRGIEEALIAPDIATNRSEAPPAIRTRQEEAGLRLAFGRNLTLVTGVFHIAKPYYNLDPALRYRQLGDVSIRGIEVSLTGRPLPGLTVVLGTALLDPQISGEAVTSGLIGPTPIGQARRRSVANFDWRLARGRSPVSFDLALESYSTRMGNAANTLAAPARSVFNLGARYRFRVGKVNLLLRPRVENLFDNYGWNVTAQRRLYLYRRTHCAGATRRRFLDCEGLNDRRAADKAHPLFNRSNCAALGAGGAVAVPTEPRLAAGGPAQGCFPIHRVSTAQIHRDHDPAAQPGAA